MPTAHAKPRGAASETREQDPDAAAIERARERFMLGNAAYETFQYERAIELFTEAYAELPDSVPGIRIRMAYNIALAYGQQYEIDHDVDNLERAVRILESWVTEFEAMYVTDDPQSQAELAEARERITQLRRRIAEAESGDRASASEDASTAPQAERVSFSSALAVTPELRAQRDRARASNESEGLIAVGWALGGVGTLLTISGASALAATRNDAGRYGGAGALGLGGVMLVSGAVLLGVGYRKRKRVRAGDYSVVPVAGPRLVGVSIGGRF